jgi:predicted enzyme related to lactoylglutathione lyase
MTPSFLGLRTAIYRVPELDRAKAWYAEVLGVQPYYDEPYYVGFSIGGFEFGLQPVEGDYANGAGGVETYWGVNDVQAMYDRLLKLGATEREAPQDVGGDIVVATVLDPWGNIFGMIFNPHFSNESTRG